MPAFSRFLFLSFFVLCAFAVPQKATAQLKCEQVYDSDAKHYLKSLSITEGKTIWSRILMKAYLRKWNPDRVHTPQSFERALSSSYALLYKLRLKQGLIQEPKFGYHQDEIIRWAERALLRDGLKGYLQGPNSKPVAWPQKAYVQVEKMMMSPVFKMIRPFILGTLHDKTDREIPPALLAKVIVDGIDPHFAELRAAYGLQGQNKIESYRRLRHVIKYLSLSFTALNSFSQLENYTNRESAQKKMEITAELENTSKNLAVIEEMLDKGVFDKN